MIFGIFLLPIIAHEHSHEGPARQPRGFWLPSAVCLSNIKRRWKNARFTFITFYLYIWLRIFQYDCRSMANGQTHTHTFMCSDTKFHFRFQLKSTNIIYFEFDEEFRINWRRPSSLSTKNKRREKNTNPSLDASSHYANFVVFFVILRTDVALFQMQEFTLCNYVCVYMATLLSDFCQMTW